MFSVKSLNPARLTAVLGPEPAQPSPKPSDRGGGARVSGVPLRFLGAHFRYLKPFFLVFKSAWRWKVFFWAQKLLRVGPRVEFQRGG